MRLRIYSLFRALLVCLAVMAGSVICSHSAGVTLSWDANVPAPEGYRVYVREDSQNYNLDHPIWQDDQPKCTLVGLVAGVTYHFVVHAYVGDLESEGSVEVLYTLPAEVSNQAPTVDAGQDQVAYEDASATLDGSNSSGTDSTTDSGTANEPTGAAEANVAPNAPEIDTAMRTDRVSLTPLLVTEGYADTDNDDHFQTQWQIGTEPDFSALVLDETSKTQLNAYTVGEMVLDVDTLYYWRVRFIDSCNGVSDWSQTATFTTIVADASHDADGDGIPDAQKTDESVDVNGNGIPDALEHRIMSVKTVEGETIVGVETVSEDVPLVSIKSIPAEAIADQSMKMEFGLVGFKVYLQNEAKTADVTIHFANQVPEKARLYKYNVDTGWELYENAVFASDGTSVTLTLEDGGPGDEDGVVNGVIVDPSGIAYADSMASDSDSVRGSGGGGAGCFISSASDDLTRTRSVFWGAGILVIMLFAACWKVKSFKLCG